MQLEDLFKKYGEPFYVGSKHVIWRDVEQNKAIKMTRPGYLNNGSMIVSSQPWHEPADPKSPYPSIAEMAEYMEAFGFTCIDSDNWRRADGFIARNVKPKDFIKTTKGVVVIDICLKELKA